MNSMNDEVLYDGEVSKLIKLLEELKEAVSSFDNPQELIDIVHHHTLDLCDVNGVFHYHHYKDTMALFHKKITTMPVDQRQAYIMTLTL